VGLPHQPASATRVHLKKDKTEVAAFIQTLRAIPPAER
jgi:hypothetical protein